MPTDTTKPSIIRPGSYEDGARSSSFRPYLDRGFERRGPYTVQKIRETPAKKVLVKLVECPACEYAFDWREQPGAHLHGKHSPSDFDL